MLKFGRYFWVFYYIEANVAWFGGVYFVKQREISFISYIFYYTKIAALAPQKGEAELPHYVS